MKFTAALVILAVAIASNASVIPLSHWGDSWGHSVQLHSPAVWASPIHTEISHWGSAPVHHHAELHQWATPVHHIEAHLPAAVELAPAHVAIHSDLHHHHEHSGSYVAANRGSVHVAPLPGHTSSAQSLNLQAAPGTW